VKRLLLARHALAGSNRDATASCSLPGEGLTPEGIEQARQLGVALRNEEIDLGVATELRRARETLELALDGRDVTLVEVSELNEIDFGRFDGGPLDTYRTWAAAEPPALAAPGGGESRAAAAARYARGLRILLARREETILAIAHALVVRYVVDAAEGLVPLPLMEPVEHAVARVLSADEVAAAAVLLDGWSRAPRFRDLPVA